MPVWGYWSGEKRRHVLFMFSQITQKILKTKWSHKNRAHFCLSEERVCPFFWGDLRCSDYFYLVNARTSSKLFLVHNANVIGVMSVSHSFIGFSWRVRRREKIKQEHSQHPSPSLTKGHLCKECNVPDKKGGWARRSQIDNVNGTGSGYLTTTTYVSPHAQHWRKKPIIL